MKEPLLKEIKGVFKPPKKKYYFGKVKFGCPYFYPRNWNPTVISIRREKRKYERNKTYKIFNRYVSIGWPIVVKSNGLGWKEKFQSPRFEWSPSFHLFFFKWQFCIWWTAPFDETDEYYEMILWWKYWCDKDIEKATETWPWCSNGVSTWNENYLINQ